VLAVAAASPTPALAASVTDPGATTTRVSVGSAGQADSASAGPSLSAHGRYVAFYSEADNLVPGDANGWEDVFVRDRLAGTTRLVSLSPAGTQFNGPSLFPSISADGRLVVWESISIAPDGSSTDDVFIRDLVEGITSQVSVGIGGREPNGRSGKPHISADGRYVAFESTASNLVRGDTNGVSDVFVRDLTTGAITRVSVGAGGQANAAAGQAAISADGRFVTWSSTASNLVAGDTNHALDVFLRDRLNGVTRRMSVSTTNVQGNGDSGMGGSAISADGRYVAYSSTASNLAPNDTNGSADVFVRDRATGVTKRISLTSDGRQGNRESGHDLRIGMSADGRFVAYTSLASNLVPNDANGHTPDVFVRDRRTGATSLISRATSGEQGSQESINPVFSADGLHVAFESEATNLVTDADTNEAQDVFMRDAPFTG
jgi:Tol biopolymer transport system component